MTRAYYAWRMNRNDGKMLPAALCLHIFDCRLITIQFCLKPSQNTWVHLVRHTIRLRFSNGY